MVPIKHVGRLLHTGSNGLSLLKGLIAMRHHGTTCRRTLIHLGQLSFVALALAIAAPWSYCQGLIYVDAKDNYYSNPNLFTASGHLINGSQTDILNPDGQIIGDDAWGWVNFGVPDSAANAEDFTTVYESQQEDSPEILMRLGLEPGANLNDGTTYDVYVVYWGDTSGNWGVRGGFTPGEPNGNQLFDSDGAIEDAIQGSLGSSAAWTTPPLDNMTDELDPQTDPPSLTFFASDDNDDPFNDSTPGAPDASDRLMRLGLIGSINPTSGTIDVYVDDIPAVDNAGGRTFFDGLAYVESGNPVFATGTLNRDTGNLTIENPTGLDFQVVSYSLESPSGSLDAGLWQTESENDILGDPDGDWAVTSETGASELVLSEEDAGNGAGATFSQLGDTINFGNVWRRGPYEDVTVRLTLDNGQLVSINPEFTGTEIAMGDFNADGNIDTTDYVALVNGLHVEHDTTSLAYSLGDATGDGLVNRADVVLFQTLFDANNGQGAFQQMVAQLSVPEPSTGLIAVVGCALFGLRRKRRHRNNPLHRETTMPLATQFHHSSRALLGLIFCGLVLAASPASAAPVVGWQRDNLVTGGVADPIITGADTNSPSIGEDLGNGMYSEGGADQVALWGATPEPVSLVNGRQVQLTGQVRIVGSSQAGNQAFRFGIFNDISEEEERDEPVLGWLGYLAGNTGDGNDGLLTAKNPDDGGFLTAASPVSTNSIATELGGDGRVFVLAEGGGTDTFINGTYDFNITIGRYGDEVTVSAGMNLLQAEDPPGGDFNEDSTTDGFDFLAWQRGESPNPLSAEDLTEWQNGYGGGTASYTFNLGGGVDNDEILPVATDEEGMPVEVTPHVTFEYNRVAFLLADHLNADYVQFDDIQIEDGNIEALELNVNRTTGEVTLMNNSDNHFQLNYYEITSRDDVLSTAAWNSLAGDSTIDGVEWDQAAGSDSGILSEINLTGTPLDAPADTTGIHNFGAIYEGTSAENEDLSFFFTQSDGVLVRGIVTYTGSYPSSLAVPEPASCLLMVLGGVAVATLRRSVGERGIRSTAA